MYAVNMKHSEMYEIASEIGAPMKLAVSGMTRDA